MRRLWEQQLLRVQEPDFMRNVLKFFSSVVLHMVAMVLGMEDMEVPMARVMGHGMVRRTADMGVLMGVTEEGTGAMALGMEDMGVLMGVTEDTEEGCMEGGWMGHQWTGRCLMEYYSEWATL